MHRVNIYQDFPHGEFKYLETRAVWAEDREDAKRIVLEYAKRKYEGMNVRVMNVN